MSTYNENLKERKIEELELDIESLKQMKEGDMLPGSGRSFVERRLSRYLRTAEGNLRVAKAANPNMFVNYENEHIIFTDDFADPPFEIDLTNFPRT